jgi:hypothetical protein
MKKLMMFTFLVLAGNVFAGSMETTNTGWDVSQQALAAAAQRNQERAQEAASRVYR